MELSKPKASEKYVRKISIGLLKKSKIQVQHEFGGISQRSVSMRYEGLKLRLMLDSFSHYSFKLDHCNVSSLIADIVAKTEKLKESYREIFNLESYLEKPFTPHDIHRAIAAMDYQQERLKEVQRFLLAAKKNGKGPIKALTEMSPELFRKEAPSDRWQGGRRMATKNPLEAIAVVIRPTEVRIALKFFEALVENIYTFDDKIAEAVPVIDYGLAIYEQSLKLQKGTLAVEAPATTMQIDALVPSAEAERVKRSAQQQKLSKISQHNLERNLHHIRGYLKSMNDFYSSEQLAERCEILLEDIFQILKCRVAISSAEHDLEETELREVFKQSLVGGLEFFERKFSGGVAIEKLKKLVERSQIEELTVTAKSEPKNPPAENFGALQAYVRTMSY